MNQHGNNPFGEPVHFAPPRPSVLHLLAWAITGVILWQFDRVLRLAEFFEPETGRFSLALYTVHILTSSAAVTGVFVLLHGRIREDRGHLQPGHWVIVGIGFQTFIYFTLLTLGMLALQAIPDFPIDPKMVLLIVRGLTFAGAAGVWSWAAAESKYPLRWQRVLRTFAAVSAILALLCAYDFFSYSELNHTSRLLWACLLVGGLLTGIILDRVRGMHRDWLHWFGLVNAAIHLVAWGI
jgi:hypothetical protein